ncbi:DUF6507 family protein [Streptomyces sp. G45]|uniref:DUF6507 family protein n=1 Tax=Streptomyces sp. G45 TaxID=3406627 RepID=UPI003C28BBFC
MTGWDISPSGVSSVVSLVKLAMDDMAKDVKAYGKDVQSAATWAGTIGPEMCPPGPPGPVGTALALFVERTAGEVLYLGARAAKSVNGAIEATNFYVAGDLEHAANAQRRARQAIDVKKLLEDAREKSGRRQK